jgi:hypothetical protein
LNDLSNLKAPGWQRVVAELASPAPDDKLFLIRLSVLGQVSDAAGRLLTVPAEGRPQRAAGRAGLAARPDVVDARRRPFPPESPSSPGVNEPSLLHTTDARPPPARQGLPPGHGLLDRRREQMYDPGARGHAMPAVGAAGRAGRERPLFGAVTLTVEPQPPGPPDHAALLEVLAGYVYMHGAQQALRASTPPPPPSTGQAPLRNQLDLRSRAAPPVRQRPLPQALRRPRGPGLGPRRANAPRQGTQATAGRAASASSPPATPRTSTAAWPWPEAEAAMDECLTRETVLYPGPRSAAPRHRARRPLCAHRELAASDAKLKVASFPLRVVDAQGR